MIMRRATPARPVSLLVTCEHGGNRVPALYRTLFAGQSRLLASHRGHDAGSLAMARRLARRTGAMLITASVTRLLVDLNRSVGHPRLLSEFSRRLPPADRQALLRRHYFPYRQRVESWIAAEIARGRRVVHVSSHSFTPVLAGQVRRADLGLLYDPSRRVERSLCEAWQRALMAADAGLRVRRNYPYAGTADGLTTALRRRFGPDRYAGIELEVNQRYPLAGGRAWSETCTTVGTALMLALGVDRSRLAGAVGDAPPPRRRRMSSHRL